MGRNIRGQLQYTEGIFVISMRGGQGADMVDGILSPECFVKPTEF